MTVRIHLHARARILERGASEAEVVATVAGGERFTAKAESAHCSVVRFNSGVIPVGTSYACPVRMHGIGKHIVYIIRSDVRPSV